MDWTAAPFRSWRFILSLCPARSSRVLAAPLYIAESFDSELLESLTEAGVLAYYQADGKLCVTGG